jgi:salicylate hydroxylase
MSNWTICKECEGSGKKRRRLSKKARFNYQIAFDLFEKSNRIGAEPIRPKGHLYSCTNCAGSGLIKSDVIPAPDQSLPQVAIIGAGIGGLAMAIACLHRNIPFSIYERDHNFEARSQGYGLTLQQAFKAMEGLGVFSLKKGVVSTRHVVHTVEGKIIAEWGMRKWIQSNENSSPKRTNIHIARQSLRLTLLEQLGGHDKINWSHKLVAINQNTSNGVDLTFNVNGELHIATVDILVGADGIRSSVRKLLIGEGISPLHYLGCIVILGICYLKDIAGIESSLLDSATVFQTANGNERIYIMPFDSESVMWQLSFPISEPEAKALSIQGSQKLKEEACRRTQWHNPIPQILAATKINQVSGYPVYDRDLLTSTLLNKCGNATLIGDAAHPMSPFKGQGANQAILDALALARAIKKGCTPFSNWKELGVRKSALTDFESEMLERSSIKVNDSAEAVNYLHSDIVLQESDKPRGSCVKRKDQ